MGQIMAAGGINMDIVVQTARQPLPGETIIGTDLHYIPGGKGSNQAVAASRLGGDVSFIGKVGSDSFGLRLKKFLDSEKLCTDGVSIAEGSPTGIALVVVDKSSENSIVAIPGSNAELSATDIARIEMNPGVIAISQFEIPFDTIEVFFEQARLSDGITILNPSPAKKCPSKLLSLADYMILDETELAFFADLTDVSEEIEEIFAHAKAIRAFPDQTIIVTLGAKGVVCSTNDELIQIPGHAVEAADTTGAGDCFVGAIATALSSKQELKSAIEFANAAAAVSVQRFGASTSLPTLDEVKSFPGFQEVSSCT